MDIYLTSFAVSRLLSFLLEPLGTRGPNDRRRLVGCFGLRGGPVLITSAVLVIPTFRDPGDPDDPLQISDSVMTIRGSCRQFTSRHAICHRPDSQFCSFFLLSFDIATHYSSCTPNHWSGPIKVCSSKLLKLTSFFWVWWFDILAGSDASRPCMAVCM